MATYNHLAWAALTITALVAVVAPPHAEAAISCGTVAQTLVPCVSYLRSSGDSAQVPAGCCSGIRSLNSAAHTTTDRQAVCGCLKSAASAMPNINMGLASSVPKKCGVNLPYKLDPSIDCSKVA